MHTETQKQCMAGQSTGGLTFHPSTNDRMNQLSIRVTQWKRKEWRRKREA